MSSNQSCQSTLNQEVNTFNAIVFISLALTVVVRYIIYRPMEVSRRRALARYSIMAGVLKIALAISLFTVLWPTCPDTCLCGTDFTSFYPIVALVIGLLWVKEGLAEAAAHDDATATTEEATGERIAFATIPMEEYGDKQKLPLAVAVSSVV